MTKRININLSDKAWEELEKLAESKGKNISDTIRDALGLALLADETSTGGGRVLVERKGQKAREIILR